MAEDDMIDTVVYRCAKCLNDDERIPCIVVMADGDIPDHCLFERGGLCEWEPLR
jgi:hypothetical protein